MAYYYSDADHYQYQHQYQPQYQNQYQPQYQYQYQHQFQYQNDYQYQYCYAPTETLVPRAHYYSDRYNAYEVSDGYYYWHGDQSTRYPIAYSVAAGYSEPKRVEWEDGGVDPVNMDGESDDASDDDDYDPTPYDGGYDIVAAYGKPLPASDSICYPRSGSNLEWIVSDAAPVPAPNHVPTSVSNVIVPVDGFESDSCGEGSDSEISDGSEDTSGCDVSLSGNGLDYDAGGAEVGEQYGDGFGDREAVSSGASDELSSESPGFCDGLYGYLPCLNKKRNKAVISDECIEKAYEDQWKAAADFLFGSLDPYANGVPGYTSQL